MLFKHLLEITTRMGAGMHLVPDQRRWVDLACVRAGQRDPSERGLGNWIHLVPPSFPHKDARSTGRSTRVGSNCGPQRTTASCWIGPRQPSALTGVPSCSPRGAWPLGPQPAGPDVFVVTEINQPAVVAYYAWCMPNPNRPEPSTSISFRNWSAHPPIRCTCCCCLKTSAAHWPSGHGDVVLIPHGAESQPSDGSLGKQPRASRAWWLGSVFKRIHHGHSRIHEMALIAGGQQGF